MNNQLEQYIHSKSLLSRWKGIKKMSNETSILFTFPPPNQIHMKGNHFHPSLFSILLQTKISTIPMNHTHTHTHTLSLSLSLFLSLSLSSKMYIWWQNFITKCSTFIAYEDLWQQKNFRHIISVIECPSDKNFITK